MITFDNVDKFILKNINIHIPKGTIVGLVGRSGVGKTTFLKLACGFLKSEAGCVYVDGREQQPYCRGNVSQIGVLFTDRPIFNDKESVKGSFEALKLAYRMSDEEFNVRYAELSKMLGFDACEEQKVSNLSLGQRRRAELGAVLLHKPRLLILDEPTSGLDENAKDTFRRYLKRLVAEGVTVVISSHDLVDISEICDRIAVLDGGKLVYYGSEDMLIKKFMPVDKLLIKVDKRLPDVEDLPLIRYKMENDELVVEYNSNHITSAEILRMVMSQTSVTEVKVYKSDIADAIMNMEKGAYENE